jgi:transposase
MDKEYIGIDVSKDNLDAAAYVSGKKWRLPNSDAGINKLLDILREISPALVVLEATGGYETPAAYELNKARIPFAVINPRESRDFAKATKKLAKTDTIDARVLAHFAAAIKPEPRPMADEQTQELEVILARRRQVIEMLTAEKNRLHTARKPVIEAINAHIDYLEKELSGIGSNLKGRIAESPVQQERYKLLHSVPGVGDNVAATLVIDLPELGKINNKQIATLVGVAPLNHDSGSKRGKCSPWGGRPQVRAALYMAALVASRCNPVISSLYVRLCAMGKAKKVALVACMHKLLIIMNSMLRHKTFWDYGPPLPASR